jgi:hypothetical protein
MGLTREEKINILMAQDMIGIKKDLEFEDYSFLCSILEGNDFKQYKDWSDDEVNSEFKDRFQDILDEDDGDTLALAHKINGEPIDLLRLESVKTLKPFKVTLHENKKDKLTMAFFCLAEDEDHAKEQTLNAYPNYKVVNVFICNEEEYPYKIHD